MKVSTLVILIAVALVAIGGLTFFFQNYLVARVVGPNNNPATVKSGEIVAVQTRSNTQNQITIELCGTGQGCFPVYSGPNTKSINVRIPIGYPAGKNTINVSEKIPPSSTHLIYSFGINIQ